MTKVFVKINSENFITSVNSSAFLDDTNGWILIDEGEGDRYTHAQGNYFDKPLTTDSGAYQYWLDGKTPVEFTAEEIAEQEAKADATTTPTTEDRLEALEAAMLEMIIGGVTE